MEQKRLKELIQKGESNDLEFKKSLSLSEPIGKTISSFSNARGGTLVIGVTDSGEVKGVDVGENTLEKLANRIKHHTDPKIYPSISTAKVDGKDLVIIEVKDVQDCILPSSLTVRKVPKNRFSIEEMLTKELARAPTNSTLQRLEI